MMFPLAAAFASLAALFAAVQAQNTNGLQITSPGGPDLWWVDEAINVISWTCHTSPYNNFTVMIANQDPTKWASFAIIAIESNYDCSKEITAEQQTAPSGTGYLIQLTNTLNETDIWAQSQPFEIKAAGAAYPATTATPSPSATGSSTSGSGATSSGSGSAAQNSAGSTKSNSASKTSAAGLVSAAAAVLGLFFA